METASRLNAASSCLGWPLVVGIVHEAPRPGSIRWGYQRLTAEAEQAERNRHPLKTLKVCHLTTRTPGRLRRLHVGWSLFIVRFTRLSHLTRPCQVMTSSPHVVLLGVPKKPNHPSPSGFCQKLETFLRYSSISYELRDTYPFKAPKGKVPYTEITHDDKTVTIPDSHFIIQYLVDKGLIKDPDELAGLTAAQRAESRAFQAYVEEVLYSAVVYDRWFVDENYAVTAQETFGDLPWPVRSFMPWFFRRRVTGVLYSAGVGRHSPEEVYRLQKEAFEALEAKYAEHKYLHGGELPSCIDLTVYGFLANILTTGGNPYFTSLVLKSTVLRSFVREMSRLLFPEYEDLLAMVQSESS